MIGIHQAELDGQGQSHIASIYDIYWDQHLRSIVDNYQSRIESGEILHQYDAEHMAFRLSQLTQKWCMIFTLHAISTQYGDIK